MPRPSRMAFGFNNIDWMRWGIVALAITIVIVAVLMVAGVNLKAVVATDMPRDLVFWKKFDPVVPLRVTVPEVKDLVPFSRYTLSVDMIWIDSRVRTETAATTGRYRHILHRGSGEVADYMNVLQTIQNTSATGATAEDVLARLPFGLPVRMNPGIMADPVTNDMLIFVDTVKDNRQQRESVRIPDIPMEQPFQLSIVVLHNMLEVYVNCRLEVTKLLEGIPREVDAAWYGLAGPRPLNAAIQNLRLFDGGLDSGQVGTLCKKVPQFPEIVMTMCSGESD